ncbi:MAG: hypothetical protein BWY26_00632 [Elusimicrobia bacterium ADurb.Bin231]|nr:MAG: hypothetical protein BWY26_00632 [Elusimicrobia bacterium ADurb.Bin231]
MKKYIEQCLLIQNLFCLVMFFCPVYGYAASPRLEVKFNEEYWAFDKDSIEYAAYAVVSGDYTDLKIELISKDKEPHDVYIKADGSKNVEFRNLPEKTTVAAGETVKITFSIRVFGENPPEVVRLKIVSDSDNYAAKIVLLRFFDTEVSTEAFAAYSGLYMKRYKHQSGLTVDFPSSFDVLDAKVFQSIIPISDIKTKDIKILLFALNSSGGEPKITVAENIYKKPVNIDEVLNLTEAEYIVYGTIFKKDIIEKTSDFAIAEYIFLTSEGKVFITQDKIFVSADENGSFTKSYVISVGALFENYLKYKPLINLIVNNCRFVAREE